jgi:putative transcriptional regulator
LKPLDRVTAGTFLVASPLLRDPNFVRTVVLMCDHGDAGSWGLVLNRRTPLTFGELLDDLPFPASGGGPVYWGGPCETSRMQVLHRLRRELPREVEVLPGVRLGLDPDTFRRVIAESRLPGEALQAYVGYAGWGEGQLDGELQSGSWIICSGDSRIVFETEAERAWDRVLESLGPPYARLTRVPLDPRLN